MSAAEYQEVLASIALRLRLLSTDGMKPEQTAWIDKTRHIADGALLAADAEEVVAANGETTTAVKPLEGLAKFLHIADGLDLVRFSGRDEVKLVGRRKGSSGNPNTIFEIDVERAEKVATVWRDERILFEIKGVTVGQNYVEQMAISSLKRWFKRQRKHTAARRSKAAAKAEGGAQ